MENNYKIEMMVEEKQSNIRVLTKILELYQEKLDKQKIYSDGYFYYKGLIEGVSQSLLIIQNF